MFKSIIPYKKVKRKKKEEGAEEEEEEKESITHNRKERTDK